MMKRTLLVIALMCFATATFAQNKENWDSRFSVNAGFYTNTKASNLNLSGTLEYAFCFKERLALGLGTGVIYSKNEVDGGKSKLYPSIPIYAVLYYKTPISRATSFMCGVNIGYSTGNLKKEDNGNFLIWPQIGFSFNTGKQTAINVLAGYRYDKVGSIGIGIGFSF